MFYEITYTADERGLRGMRGERRPQSGNDVAETNQVT